MKKFVRKIECMLDFVFILSVLLVVWLLLQVTSLASFSVPSSSMEPTLQSGDCILVNKWVIGARIFNPWDVAEGKETKVCRLPGMRKAKRNDVLVFHNPYPIMEDSLSMDMQKYYVKRCVGLPGDTVVIKNCCYRVNGTNEVLGHLPTQEHLARLEEFDIKNICIPRKIVTMFINSF